MHQCLGGKLVSQIGSELQAPALLPPCLLVLVEKITVLIFIRAISILPMLIYKI